MRLIVLLLMLIGTIILLVQNQQAITLYFLGNNVQTALFSLKLPLGLWVILFTLGGILTSLLMQLLTRSPRPMVGKKPTNPRPRPQEPAETPYQRPQPKKSDWETPPQAEWENSTQEEEEDDEWDIEEPPLEKTIPRKPSMVEDTRSEFEVQQQPPKTVSREGTVYSYTYRELSDRISSQPPEDAPKVEEKSSPSEPKGEVYDANYRVITPPYQPGQRTDNEEENDESWI